MKKKFDDIHRSNTSAIIGDGKNQGARKPQNGERSVERRPTLYSENNDAQIEQSVDVRKHGVNVHSKIKCENGHRTNQQNNRDIHRRKSSRENPIFINHLHHHAMAGQGPQVGLP